MKEHAEHEEAGTLNESRVENDRPPVATPACQPAALQAKTSSPTYCSKPKSRLAALCHKPALLHIKQIGTH